MPVPLPCSTPAFPVGVALSSPVMTVTDVTVDLLPSDRIVVCTAFEVVIFLVVDEL